MKRIILYILVIGSITLDAQAKSGAVTLSECIAEASSVADVIECVRRRDELMDTAEDLEVYKCLINGDDKKIYWYEDCIGAGGL